jgi:hypothetical protein
MLLPQATGYSDRDVHYHRSYLCCLSLLRTEIHLRLVRRRVQSSTAKMPRCHVGNYDKPRALNYVPEKKQKGKSWLRTSVGGTDS